MDVVVYDVGEDRQHMNAIVGTTYQARMEPVLLELVRLGLHREHGSTTYRYARSKAAAYQPAGVRMRQRLDCIAPSHVFWQST